MAAINLSTPTSPRLLAPSCTSVGQAIVALRPAGDAFPEQGREGRKMCMGRTMSGS
jgi:hypothetical protein